jgi:hypothetical protein
MEIRYVHVQWSNGSHDMVPEKSAPLLEKVGDLTIVDPTPTRYGHFKPRLPLGEPASPKQKKTTRVVTEPAPTGATTAEEATQ